MSIVIGCIILTIWIGLLSYFIWTMQLRIESVFSQLVKLEKKVREGEHAIVENFEIIEKRFTKVNHDIKEASRAFPKAQEALQTAHRAERARTNK